VGRVGRNSNIGLVGLGNVATVEYVFAKLRGRVEPADKGIAAEDTFAGIKSDVRKILIAANKNLDFTLCPQNLQVFCDLNIYQSTYSFTSRFVTVLY
jgi:hypothetical protein